MRAGGEYVWEAEFSSVTLMETELNDEQANMLFELSGIEQIAINATALSFSTVSSLCYVTDLKSLVLGHCTFSNEQIEMFKQAHPSINIEVV
jgi:hypothetical protein